jgi:hypothetical protein
MVVALLLFLTGHAVAQAHYTVDQILALNGQPASRAATIWQLRAVNWSYPLRPVNPWRSGAIAAC